MKGMRTAVTLALMMVSAPLAHSGPVTGDIHGIVRDSDGRPVAAVDVSVHGVNGNSDRTVLTGSDGSFLVDTLQPGQYHLMVRKEGYQSSLGPTVEIDQRGKSVAIDMTLSTAPFGSASKLPARAKATTPIYTAEANIAAAGSRAPAAGSQAQGSTVKLEEAPLTERERQLLDRIDRLEQRLAALEAKDASQTAAGTKTAPGAELLLASANAAGVLPPAKPLLPNLPSPGPAQGLAQGLTGKALAPQAAAPVAPVQHVLPEAMEAPSASPGVDNFTPFAYGDFTWLNGTPRNKDTVLDTKFFTPEVRFDTHFMEDFNQPRDHTMGGATESFRSGEIQVEQISVGGDFHWQNVRGRILTMDGLFATTTPRNDASAGVGQWDVRGAYKYVSEAYGGYHFNIMHGLNVDAGIFVSYIGLFSYYNFDNWAYQPSYVSSNTPWFFNGVRIQFFPTNKLKIEPWIINGWQSYNKYNSHLGLGGQILYMPKEWLKLVFNQYGYGQDNLGIPLVQRIHTDDSIEVRYYNRPENKGIDKMAFSLTGDLGCQYGPGFRCTGGATKDSFAGWMGYNRIWWGKDKYGITYGGGRMNNPGRYLTLLPPIDGADAVSGSPYFTTNPGQPAHMWDNTLTFQWMPREYITWWAEAGYRHSDIPYFTGRGGITPPGGNNGSPQYYTCMSGATAGTSDLPTAEFVCGGGLGSVWFPDLRKTQSVVSMGVMVKF